MRTREFITGMAVGAGLVYFLDPERGAERRRRWRAELENRLHETVEPEFNPLIWCDGGSGPSWGAIPWSGQPVGR